MHRIPPLTEFKIKLLLPLDTVEAFVIIKSPLSPELANVPIILLPEMLSDPPEMFWPGALIPAVVVRSAVDVSPPEIVAPEDTASPAVPVRRPVEVIPPETVAPPVTASPLRVERLVAVNDPPEMF